MKILWVSIFNLIFFFGILQPGFSMNLDQAIDRALEANLDLRSASAELEASTYEASSAWRDFLPKLKAEAMILNQSNTSELIIPAGSIDIGSGLPPVPAEPYINRISEHHIEDYSLTILQPITPLYKVSVGYRLRSAKREFSRAGFYQEKDRIVSDTVESYCQLLMARKLVDLSRIYIEELNAHLKRVESFFKVGHVLQRDLYQVELGLDNAKFEFAVNQRKVEIARQRLVTILNIKPGELAPLEEPPEFTMPDYDLPDLWEAAVKNRPELHQAQLGLKAAQLQRKLTLSDFIPDILLFGSCKIQHGDYSSPEDNQVIGVRLDATLFEWGKSVKNAQADKMRIQKAQLVYNSATEMIKLDVTNSYHELLNNWDQLQVAKKNFELADESLRITKKQYDAGRATITDLLNDQTTFHRARTQIELARYQLIISDADLKRALADLN
jgi:outer membrane protein